MKLVLKLAFWLFAYIFCVFTAANAAPSDRLVVSVNNIPYSQLQIEGFLNTKEALRADAHNSQLVDATNWTVAVQAFIADMVVYQEANRSSATRPQKELVRKALDRVKNTLTLSERFQRRFLALGIHDDVIREHLSHLLAIENLKKSRQTVETKTARASTNNSGTAASSNPNATPSSNVSFENELLSRAIIRWFDNGKTYIDIHPTQ